MKVSLNNAVFIQCIFASIRSSSAEGGAIQMSNVDAKSLKVSKCIFDDCRFKEKLFGDMSSGGALFVFMNDEVKIERSCFIECHADDVDCIIINAMVNQPFIKFNSSYFYFGKIHDPLQISTKSEFICNSLNCSNMISIDEILFEISNIKFSYFLAMNCRFHLEFVDSCVFEKCNCSKFNAKLITCCSFIDFINEDCVFNITIDPSKPLYSDKNISSLMNSIVVTKDVPVPKIEETLCPVLNIWNNVSNVKPNKSMNYIYLPPVLEIVECEFKDISVIADSGSAINFDHPMYEFLSYDPKIKIDSCLFLNCVSDSCPGAVRINYTHAQVSINKMCSLNCGGNNYAIFCILTNSSARINASTIFSTHDTITQYERYASGINPLPKYIGNYSISFLNGLNHTHGKYFTAPHDGLGVNVSYSHFENLSSLSFLGIDNSNILKCNFIEVTCDITYGINLNYIFYECVFDKTNIIDNFEYRFKSPIEKINETFINCYIKKYNETFDGKIISLDLYRTSQLIEKIEPY